MRISKTVVFFTFISLAALLGILWLVDFSGLGIPVLIPELQLRTYGVLILVTFIIIFIFLQKRLLKTNPLTPVLTLVLSSIVVAFSSLLFYQAIRQLVILRGQYTCTLSTVLLSSAIPTIAFALVAASVALELKKVKGIWKHVPTVILLVLVLLAKKYLPPFEW